MKYAKILTLCTLLAGMHTGSRAQVFQVFQKDMNTTKFQASEVDSVSHNDADALTTFYLKNGSKQTFRKAETDSIVWYDPTYSILSTLRKKGNFTYFLRLLEESTKWNFSVPWMEDKLNGATDLVAFVANDDSWKHFFAENAKLPEYNPWHIVTSYDALTIGQKRALLYSAITDDNGTGCQSQEIIHRKTPAAGLEQLQHLSGTNIPTTYNPVDKWYWERFSEKNGGNGVYIVADSTYHYTSFLTPEQIEYHGFTDLDCSILFPKNTKSIANGVEVLQQNIPTSNGSLNETAVPLIPLQSMAEVIRTNDKTNIFSHMLDRYSAPFYNHRITIEYMVLNPEFKDSIFTKRYFSYMSSGGRALNSEPGPYGTYKTYYPFKYTMDAMPKELKYYTGAGEISLKYDPAWNEYYEDALHPENREKDMAAMFVPSDKALWDYFTSGAGLQLVKTYYVLEGTEYEIPYETPTTYEELYKQIDCIPLSTLQRLINTIMLRSFVSSVPSKMTKLKDDALAQLFYPEDIEKIDTCLWASNGVVYVMDKVYGPADYTSITAPAFMSSTNKIMNWAIYDQNNLGLNYYVYLKAPQQNITFFLPTDAAMAYYYDPVSMKSRIPRMIEMSYKPTAAGRVSVSAKVWKYIDSYGVNMPAAGQVIGDKGGQIMGSAGSITESEVTNRLKDILLNHTIVSDDSQDINSRNEYFRTYGGDVIKVIRDGSGKITGAKGTFQLENERNGIVSQNPGVTGCNVTASYESLSNGQTYTLDAPLVPTYRSLWSVLTDDMKDNTYNPKGYSDEAWAANPYSAFFDLCNVDEEVVRACGLVDGNLPRSAQEIALKKLLIFKSDYGMDYNFVPLIGNTSYTAYIPTNEAVKRAIAQGLPTWDDIIGEYRSRLKHDVDPETGEWLKDPETGEYVFTDELETYGDSIRIAGKIMTLLNVIKAHFHYGMAIADQEPFREEYKSLVIDPETLASPNLTVQGLGNGRMTVTDWKGNTFNVTDNKNIFVRDYTCSKSPRGVPMSGITINSQRSGVVHQIDGVLGFK